MIPTTRSLRVSEQIKHILAQMLSREIRDEHLKLVNITAVKVAPSLQTAKVFITSLQQPLNQKQIINSLNHAEGFFKNRLSKELNLHRTPKLFFVYDETLEYASNLEKLIDSVVDNK